MKRVYDRGQAGRKESIQEAAPLLVKYGYQAVNVPEALLEDPALLLETDKCIKSLGLTWGMTPTPADSYAENLSDADFEKSLEKLKRWAELSERIGAKNCYNHIWNGSNIREYDAQREWVLKRAERIFNVLDPHHIRYGFEFLGPVPLQRSFKYPFSNNLAGALSIADEISPRLGFVFDTYHWYCGTGGDLGELYLAASHIDRLVNFHVDDGLNGRSREEQQDLERAMPMTTGIIDSARVYRLFEKKGYDGLIMCEPLNTWRKETENFSFEEVIEAVAKGYGHLEEAAAGN